LFVCFPVYLFYLCFFCFSFFFIYVLHFCYPTFCFTCFPCVFPVRLLFFPVLCSYLGVFSSYCMLSYVVFLFSIDICFVFVLFFSCCFWFCFLLVVVLSYVF
jgi:hypothetical protein